MRITDGKKILNPRIIDCYDLKGNWWEKVVDSMLDVKSTNVKKYCFPWRGIFKPFFFLNYHPTKALCDNIKKGRVFWAMGSECLICCLQNCIEEEPHGEWCNTQWSQITYAVVNENAESSRGQHLNIAVSQSL